MNYYVDIVAGATIPASLLQTSHVNPIKVCTRCKGRNGDWIFCPKCGTRLTAEVTHTHTPLLQHIAKAVGIHGAYFLGEVLDRDFPSTSGHLRSLIQPIRLTQCTSTQYILGARLYHVEAGDLSIVRMDALTNGQFQIVIDDVRKFIAGADMGDTTSPLSGITFGLFLVSWAS